MRHAPLLLGLCLVGLAPPARVAAERATTDQIPITTSSAEARKLYLDARDLQERLRATDAHLLFDKALAKDPRFALAQLQVALTSGSQKDLFAGVQKAVALAGSVSDGERQFILGVDAGVRGATAEQIEHFRKLVEAFPRDERAHTLLGNVYFGQQDYAKAIEQFQQATSINPTFSQPYNQLGYAYRFLDKNADAEATFKKYIELIPGDPNPYDSYAELLMKMGRFDESIRSYEKALAIDPHFVNSYVGIGNDQIFMGRGAEARKTFAKLTRNARTDGERRLALFWTAVSYLHEGAFDQALAEIEKQYAIAKAANDRANMGADLGFMGQILVEAGRPEQALQRFKASLEMTERASVPEEVKAAARRNHVAGQARVALARQDLAAARKLVASYTAQVAEKKLRFEVLQQHELAGRIALAEKSYAAAVAELEQGNLQDPRVLYLLALALQGKGDRAQASAVAAKAADFNALAPNYAYVRKLARELLAAPAVQ